MSTAANGGASLYDKTNGAGGKYRRKPLRNSQSTPYDRPPIAVRNPSGGWVSKIIDPAVRIITSSSMKLFPSLFRKRLPPPPPSVSEVYKLSKSEPKGEIHENVGDQYGTGHYAKEHGSPGNNAVDQGFYELEKMLEQKSFTKSEIDRLTALLNSRTIEAPVERNRKSPEAAASDTIHIDGNLKTSWFTTVLDGGIKSKEYPSPMAQKKVIEEDIATPAELAKAYMGSRPSKVSPSMLGSRGLATRNDVPLLGNVVFSSQSPPMNTATKPSSQLTTPRNEYMSQRSRGRSAIYSMARTPYSGMQKNADFRSSNNYTLQASKLSSESNKPSSSRQTTLKRRSSVLDDDIDSVGPIRKIRTKPGLIPSQTFNVPASQGSPGQSKDASNRIYDGTIMYVPSQSSEVAQKILQQLNKLSPSPMERLTERKTVKLQGRTPFTLTSDMLTGQALRSLEDIDSSKFIDLSLENGEPNESVKMVTTIVDYKTNNGKNQVEENVPDISTSFLNTKSRTAFNPSDRSPTRNKRAFQMSAHEEYLDLADTDGQSNGNSIFMTENMVNPSKSSLENRTQTVNVVAGVENSVADLEKKNVSNDLYKKKSAQYQAASNGPVLVKPGTFQPNVTDNTSPNKEGKESSGMQSSFGCGAMFTPITSSASAPTPAPAPAPAPLPNDSLALHTSDPSDSRTPNLSVLSNAVGTKQDDQKGAQGTGDRQGNPSSASLYGVSTTSNFISSGSSFSKGYAKGSFSGQPATASTLAPLSNFKNASDDGARNLNSSAIISFPTSVPNTETITTSGGGVLLETSATHFSASPVFSFGSSLVNDPKVSSGANGSLSVLEVKLKPVSAVSNMNSNPFGGSMTSSGLLNNTNVVSGFGSSANSSVVANNEAPTVGTATENVTKSTPLQFGLSCFPPTTSGLSEAAAVASTSAAFHVTAPTANVFGSNITHGLHSVPSSTEVSSCTVGSTSGSTNSLLGSNWNANSSPVFGSTTSSSTTPLSVFSAASSASFPSSSIPGSVFGMAGASGGSTFSFTSASANTSHSSFSPQSVFGSSNPAFTIRSAASPANNGGGNNQMSTEDTMAEDSLQASAPLTRVFAQQQSPSPSVTQHATGLFQFGSQPNPAAPVNQSPFQATGSFNAGGGFSLGSGGGDKSARKIIKVKKGPNRKR